MAATFQWNQGFGSQYDIDLNILGLLGNSFNFMGVDGVARDPISLVNTVDYYTLLNEDLSSASTGTLTGNAFYDSANDWIRLTQDAATQHGEVEWSANLNQDFEVQYSQWLTNKSGGADAIYFYWGASSTPSLGEDDASGGYLVAIDHYLSNKADIHFNGTTISTNALGSDPTDGAWHVIKITVSGNNIKIYYDSVLIVNFTDTVTRTLGGRKYGWGARTGGAWCEHRIDNLLLKINKLNKAYYYKQYPITRGNRSYTVWLRGHISGTYTSVTNAKFWNWSNLNQTYYPVYGKANTTFVQPETGSTQAGSVYVPIGADQTTPPASPIIPSTSGLVTNADGYTGWVTLQLEAEPGAIPGSLGPTGFTFQYDET